MTKLSSRIAAVVRSARELAEPIHVSGTTASARALLVARYRFEVAAPLVVLCPNDDIVGEFAADLEALSRLVDRTPLEVVALPTWEQSPYSPIAPSLKTRLTRVAGLERLVENLNAGARRPILVTTLPALCQATIPKKVFLQNRLLLLAEESVESREILVSKLLAAGYLKTDPVEDPGTFAVRGDIVDIFPPGREKPLRIELFGDLIERMREFDTGTQRAADTKEVLKSVAIPPAREVLINRETSGTVREKLKAHADEIGIPRAIRDPILHSVQDGIYPSHSDVWAPFAYGESATLLEYLEEGTEFIWNDEMTCLQDFDQFLHEQREISGEATKSEVIAPPVEQLFHWTSALERDLRARSKLYLDRIDLADLSEVGNDDEVAEAPAPGEVVIAAKHKVFVRSNADLSAGSKQSLGNLEPKFRLWMKQGFRVLALASTQSQIERIRFLLEDRSFVCQMVDNDQASQPGLISLAVGTVTEGFRWPAEGLVVITESEILGTRHATRRPKTKESSAAKDWAGLQVLSDLSPGDAIVHVDHGIGRYQGLARLDLSGAPADFLLIEYANKDKLYLPVYRLNVIQKYAGGEGVALDKLGSQQFAKAKEKVREGVKKLAFDLVQLYAERKLSGGVVFSPRDADFREFEAKFPFDETPDQLKAIDDILSDMESGRVSDRLVCGDVGYGKTEVAMRAAFRAVSDGKQVVVLVPTTVLAFQHEQSFRTRFKDYPITIDSLSRFKSAKEQKSVVEGLASGKVDIVIGTHRLLSRDIKFKDLGLVIVDEEHRFGVEHKEKLKAMKVNTHVLTLTATPIPRTLHMALSGLRDISLINTPPVDRLPIRTYVSKNDDSLIQRAIEVELNRGGQVFFLHNRVQSIYETANRIRELVPSAQVAVGHGQLPEGELEEVMLGFYHRRSNVLVCTTIIESGLDITNANTILIDRADHLGLAQLYQIRGRVGRGQTRGYAYLLIPAETAVTEDAKKRLEVIQRFVELGSGFSVASHDLDLRGGGDLLGPQQSGHIAAVGFDLYTELLEEAILEIQGKPPEVDAHREPEIKAPYPAFLAEEYVPDVHQRLSMYRRFSAAAQEAELDALEGELRDRFGPLPAEALNLVWLIRIKQLLKRTGIDTLTVGPEKISMVPGPHSKFDPARSVALAASQPRKFQLTPDSKVVAQIATSSLRDLFFAIESLFKQITPRTA